MSKNYVNRPLVDMPEASGYRLLNEIELIFGGKHSFAFWIMFNQAPLLCKYHPCFLFSKYHKVQEKECRLSFVSYFSKATTGGGKRPHPDRVNIYLLSIEYQ